VGWSIKKGLEKAHPGLRDLQESLTAWKWAFRRKQPKRIQMHVRLLKKGMNHPQLDILLH